MECCDLKMVAEKVFPYRGKALKKGDVFEVADKSHQRQLRGAGLASDLKQPKKKVDAPVKDVASKDDTAATVQPQKTLLADNEYKTRALKAED